MEHRRCCFVSKVVQSQTAEEGKKDADVVAVLGSKNEKGEKD